MVPASTPGDGAAALAEYRRNAEEKLTALFALDDAGVDELTTDPAKAVPKLMAKTLFETVQATMQAVHHFLPSLIEQIDARRTADREAESAFYKAWPKLDRKVHGTYIQQAANIHRQMNPKAKLEDIIRDVGAQTMVAFKIPQEPVRANPWNKGPAAGTTPPAPHRPAPAAPRMPDATPKRNIFTEMANDLLDGRFDDT